MTYPGGKPVLGTSPCSRQGLPLPSVTTQDCGLLPHSFHPYPLRGSFVSVALSLELPLVAVSDCLSLRCPDFPLRLTPKRPADNLTGVLYRKLSNSASAIRFGRRGIC